MSTVTQFPGIEKTIYSPTVEGFGIVLEFSEKESNKDLKIIQGVFLLPKNQDFKVYGKPHKSIVVTINFDGRYVVLKPFDEIVVLDDVEDSYDKVLGCFQFNMYDYFKYTHDGTYYIVSSLGIYISNILQITIES